jgi:hypothetical protein
MNPTFQRSDGRAPDQVRDVSFELNIAPHASGSVLVAMGNTRVICGVMIEETTPRWMKEQNVTGGWLTSEYSMLPYSTITRKPRDISKGRLDGRSTEIQRLIGSSKRTGGPARLQSRVRVSLLRSPAENSLRTKRSKRRRSRNWSRRFPPAFSTGTRLSILTTRKTKPSRLISIWLRLRTATLSKSKVRARKRLSRNPSSTKCSHSRGKELPI